MPGDQMPALRIEDYALIGDTHTAALVGNNGSIDWLCFPRFDAPACFARLVGDVDNGRWLIAPEQPAQAVNRRYLPDTMVLVTEFVTADGVVELIDFMPRAEDFHRADLVRLVRCKSGAVAMRVEVRFRLDDGRTIPWIRYGDDCLEAVAGPNGLHLVSPLPLQGDNRCSGGAFTLRQGEGAAFTLTWFPSHEGIPEPQDPEMLLDLTVRWWRGWAGRCSFGGRWREPVMRSLLTLKALTYSPAGGIVAAPTTSLPEKIGGMRNWDYRHCWLRDAALTLTALLHSGYREEAAAWRMWLLRAVAGDPAQLQILYGIAGERTDEEREMPWLSGYENSRPVRKGNGAFDQRQLDVYGQVLDVFYLARCSDIEPSDDACALQMELIDALEDQWRLDDEGLWEVRCGRRPFVHSKVMAWVAVDRALWLMEKAGVDAPVERWRRLRDEIHADVCRNGYSERLGSFVQYYGAEWVDAALLMIPLVGFLPADDPRVVGTVERIQRDLCENGLVYRYRWRPEVDGLPEGEGAFLACSFWLVDVLAMMGRKDEAVALFERLLGLANDVGLFAEEYDPAGRRHLGNFPQAFTHIGLVTAAQRLDELLSGRGPTRQRPQA